jgi:hypothetical protein
MSDESDKDEYLFDIDEVVADGDAMDIDPPPSPPEKPETTGPSIYERLVQEEGDMKLALQLQEQIAWEYILDDERGKTMATATLEREKIVTKRTVLPETQPNAGTRPTDYGLEHRKKSPGMDQSRILNNYVTSPPPLPDAKHPTAARFLRKYYEPLVATNVIPIETWQQLCHMHADDLTWTALVIGADAGILYLPSSCPFRVETWTGFLLYRLVRPVKGPNFFPALQVAAFERATFNFYLAVHTASVTRPGCIAVARRVVRELTATWMDELTDMLRTHDGDMFAPISYSSPDGTSLACYPDVPK